MSTPGDSDNDKIKWNMQAQRAIDVQLERGGGLGKGKWGWGSVARERSGMEACPKNCINNNEIEKTNSSVWRSFC